MSRGDTAAPHRHSTAVGKSKTVDTRPLSAKREDRRKWCQMAADCHQNSSGGCSRTPRKMMQKVTRFSPKTIQHRPKWRPGATKSRLKSSKVVPKSIPEDTFRARRFPMIRPDIFFEHFSVAWAIWDAILVPSGCQRGSQNHTFSPKST